MPDTSAAAGERIESIDIVRGAIMVLMALDHVRVFSGVPAGGPTPGVFFTRWITHFCAPGFAFFAGTSAWFHGRRDERLPRWLLIRGLWLVLLELTVLRLAWTFNLDFASYMLAGVIWMLGWCMILMSAGVRLRPGVLGALGLVLIATHDAFGPAVSGLLGGSDTSAWMALWKILYLGPREGPIGPLAVLYSIIPWIGVMAVGYAFGALVMDHPRRRARCLAIGLGATALFVVLRGFNRYGDPQPWSAPPAGPGASVLAPLMAFLNTNKYPASLDFLLMTLGPLITCLALLDHARGAVARWFATFGRVPLFYYLLHIPLIHALALLLSWAREGRINPWLFLNHPMGSGPAPNGYTWGLGTLYGVFALAVVLLYFPCRWFADLKGRRKSALLSYL